MCDGLPYPEIAEKLRIEFGEECRDLRPDTVMGWAKRGPISWDGCAEIHAEALAEKVSKAPGIDPKYADQLYNVQLALAKCAKTLFATGPEHVAVWTTDDLKDMRMNIGVYHAKMLTIFEWLTRGDLARLPKSSLRKLIAITLKALIEILVAEKMVSWRTVRGKATRIADEMERRLPHLIRQRTTDDDLDLPEDGDDAD